MLAKHADEAGAWLHGVKVFRYSDETAEAVASGEKLLKESETIYESFADMMSPEDAKRSLLEIVGDSLVLGGVSKGLNFVAHTAITFDAYYGWEQF